MFVYIGGNLSEDKMDIAWNDYSQTIRNNSIEVIESSHPLAKFGYSVFAPTTGKHKGCTFLEGIIQNDTPRILFVTDRCDEDAFYACIRPYGGCK